MDLSLKASTPQTPDAPSAAPTEVGLSTSPVGPVDKPIDLTVILAWAKDAGASDIHLVPEHPPMGRIHTELKPLVGFPVLTPEDTQRVTREMFTAEEWNAFEVNRDADFAWTVEGTGRFRVNAHYQREVIGLAFRSISSTIPSISQLHLPESVERLIDLPRGLVLVTGATGSGKSTTLAAMIQSMNEQYSHHIITLEDPVEYQLRSKGCVIEQRQVHADVTTFGSGLRHALRQDPDVILVGEMRDLETTSAAITAAETGHLVLSTLHTQSAVQTLQRIVDIYPGAQQNQIRSMLATTLQAVVTQTLFRRQDQPGMVPACEVMICNPAIRACIRENRLHEIYNTIETGKKEGMLLLNESILQLVLSGKITVEQAKAKANNWASLARKLGVS
jgi:twitching motility protein PilT